MKPKRRRRRRIGLPQVSERVPTDEELLRLPLWLADYIRGLRFEIEYLTEKQQKVAS